MRDSLSDPVKRHSLISALRQEPLPILLAEAAWRSLREIRKQIFRRSGAGVSPVSFQPIGYYESLPEFAPAPVLAYADAVLRGEFPLMGYGSPHLGVQPDWHCDWVSGKSWPLDDSETIQIVRHDGSDIKAPWELSRLQFAPVVADAWTLTKDPRYRDFLKSLLTHWIECNPPGKGVNWTVAMEAGLRSISMCLTMERLWPFGEEEELWLGQITASLWQHLRFIEAHSEFSFRVRSNHYLGNLAGLTTLSAYLRGPGIERRLRKYSRALQAEILLQTYPDGGDRESSTGYHLLVAQMGLHCFAIHQRCGCHMAAAFQARLQLMFAWIAALADDAGKLPLLGDCDNGRVALLGGDIGQAMKPASQRHALHAGSLQTLASHFLGTAKPKPLLGESGIAVLRAGDASVVFSAMPNGLAGKGSHTHCDKLAVVFRLGPDEVFCDSGSRCYSRSAELRNLDRSTAAHSTLLVDGMDQNTVPRDPGMLFRCGNEAAVSAITLIDGNDGIGVRASHSGYGRLGIIHQRSVLLSEDSLLLTDEVSGRGEHALDLRFILDPAWQATPEPIVGDDGDDGDDGQAVRCAIDGPRSLTLVCEAKSALALSVHPAEISREYGSGLPTSCILIHTTASLPASIQTRVEWK